MYKTKFTLIVSAIICLASSCYIALSIENEFSIFKVDSAPSAGTTLYVGGNGLGNYSNIQNAINNASDGYIVFVYAGIYHENWTT